MGKRVCSVSASQQFGQQGSHLLLGQAGKQLRSFSRSQFRIANGESGYSCSGQGGWILIRELIQFLLMQTTNHAQRTMAANRIVVVLAITGDGQARKCSIGVSIERKLDGVRSG